MADIIDDANNTADFYLGIALREQLRSVKITPAFTGFCLCCGETLSDERRWCDIACRDEYEQDQARAARD